MTGLTLTLMKLGLLAVLWVFVLISLAVIRTDLFGAAGARIKAVRPSARPVSGAVPVGQAAARPRRGGMPTKLFVTSGSLAGTSVPLRTQQITLGRAPDCTIVLHADFSSSRPPRIVP